jgi:hypothetical protein
MYNGLLHLHNFLRWVILIFLVIAVIRHLIGMTSNRKFTTTDRKIDTILMTTAHIQFLIGLYQWFAGPWGYKLLANVSMAEIMANKAYRFWVVEHNTGMLIAIVLITIGRGVFRKNISDEKKHRRAFWLFTFALLLIIASVPWPFREIIGRPWFPGMRS